MPVEKPEVKSEPNVANKADDKPMGNGAKSEPQRKAVVAVKAPVAPPVPEDRADPMPETPEQAQVLAEMKDEEDKAPAETQELKVQILFRQLENRQLECVYVTDGSEAEDYAREFGGIVVDAKQFIPDRSDVTDEDRELPSDRAMRLAKKMEREANARARANA